MSSQFKKSASYFFNRYILRRKFLIAREHRFNSRFKFKTEDVIGRHIYKRGEYEKHITDYLVDSVAFKPGGIALDIGANIGWYSILFNRLMPADGRVIAFEPDPLNYQLLCENIQLNGASNVTAERYALSDKSETKKLYRYSNKNLGRHSLLDINDDGNYVEVETRVLDDVLDDLGLDFTRLNVVKIDIEGYEYFALCGARKVLQHVPCLISEFVPAHMLKGGVEPDSLIRLMTENAFEPHLIRDGALLKLGADELKSIESADLIWLKTA